MAKMVGGHPCPRPGTIWDMHGSTVSFARDLSGYLTHCKRQGHLTLAAPGTAQHGVFFQRLNSKLKEWALAQLSEVGNGDGSEDGWDTDEAWRTVSADPLGVELEVLHMPASHAATVSTHASNRDDLEAEDSIALEHTNYRVKWLMGLIDARLGLAASTIQQFWRAKLQMADAGATIRASVRNAVRLAIVRASRPSGA